MKVAKYPCNTRRRVHTRIPKGHITADCEKKYAGNIYTSCWSYKLSFAAIYQHECSKVHTAHLVLQANTIMCDRQLKWEINKPCWWGRHKNCWSSLLHKQFWLTWTTNMVTFVFPVKTFVYRDIKTRLYDTNGHEKV